jgi:hypothetical protein
MILLSVKKNPTNNTKIESIQGENARDRKD